MVKELQPKRSIVRRSALVNASRKQVEAGFPAFLVLGDEIACSSPIPVELFIAGLPDRKQCTTRSIVAQLELHEGGTG